MHLETVSNGLGAQSMFLLLMAIRREIPATVSITADTGWENDNVWNCGKRTNAREYYESVVVPLCKGTHVTPYMVRSLNKAGAQLLPLRDQVMGKVERMGGIPLFGSRGGRLSQTCTDKMKIRAIHQQERRLGAKTVRNAQGIHADEADRRIKGAFLHMDGGWGVYQTTLTTTLKEPDGTKRKVHRPIKWQTHYYPLVDLGVGRNGARKHLESKGVPFLVSSECDGCPHKDITRWERTSPAVIDELAELEGQWEGSYFFTDRRIPLKDAIAAMQADRVPGPAQDIDFGCGNSICGV
jgi:hypothetical protein